VTTIEVTEETAGFWRQVVGQLDAVWFGAETTTLVVTRTGIGAIADMIRGAALAPGPGNEFINDALVDWADSIDAVKDGWIGLTPEQQNSAVADVAEFAADLLIGTGVRLAPGGPLVGAVAGSAVATLRARGSMYKSAIDNGHTKAEARVMANIAGVIAATLQTGGKSISRVVYDRLSDEAKERLKDAAVKVAMDVGEGLSHDAALEYVNTVIENRFVDDDPLE